MSTAFAVRQPTVIVDREARTDAALYERAGETFLVLQPIQTFTNAVAQIATLMPAMPVDQIRTLVRLHLPTAADFDSIESAQRQAAPSTLRVASPPRPLSPTARRRFAVRRVLINSLVGSIATLSLVGYLVVHGMESKPFETDEFKQFAAVGRMMCDPIDPTHARCTDVDGLVMLSSVVTSPDYTVFTFSYGAERVSMRVYANPAAAQRAAREPATIKTFANVAQAGRFMFYGTDAARIGTYVDLIKSQVPAAAKPAPRVVDLPRRLAGLAFGALNLPFENELTKQVTGSQERAVLTLLAAPAKEATQVMPSGEQVVQATPHVVFTRVKLPTQRPTPNTVLALPEVLLLPPATLPGAILEAVKALPAPVVPSVKPSPATQAPVDAPSGPVEAKPAPSLTPAAATPSTPSPAPSPAAAKPTPAADSTPNPSPSPSPSPEPSPVVDQVQGAVDGVLDPILEPLLP